MRIGLLIYDGLDSISGGYLYDRKLVEHLRLHGDQVEVISIPKRNYALNMLDNFSPALHHRVNAGEFEILLQDELNHPSLFFFNHIVPHGIKTTPTLVTIVHHLRSCENSPRVQNGFYRLIESLFLKSVDGFILNSCATRQAVLNTAPITSQHPSIIAVPGGDSLHPSVSEEIITRRAREPGALRLVFLGNIIPRKGLETLFEAILQVPPGHCRLDIIGRQSPGSNYGRKINQKIKRVTSTLEIQIQGYQENHQLTKILTGAHVLVVPSAYEGYGISYIEGMGFGLPAIGTTAGGASEIITHGTDGFLIAPGDSESLARIILELAENRIRLEEMSLAARQRYLRHPTWSQTCDRIREFLGGLPKHTAV